LQDKFLLDPVGLKLKQSLGTGEFGDVFLGELGYVSANLVSIFLVRGVFDLMYLYLQSADRCGETTQEADSIGFRTPVVQQRSFYHEVH
jgi:hypothetical protein